MKNQNNVLKVNFRKGVFEDINQAIDSAKETQRIVETLSFKKRQEIIERIKLNTLKYAEELSILAVKETGMGNVKDKIFKHQLLARLVPGTEDIQDEIITSSNGTTIIRKSPFGVIGAITPSTNPTCTVIHNSIVMLAGGNTVVFSVHPNAVNASNKAIEIVNMSSVEVGGPDNIVTSINSPTMESCDILMHHPDIKLLVATGGPEVVRKALSSGKRAIGAGAGNPPVVVDETADIEKAARDIILGCTFDNNLPCIAEKEVIVVKQVANKLIDSMINNGCYKLDEQEVNLLIKLVLQEKDGRFSVNRKFVGKDAYKILQALGVQSDESVKCLIFEADKNHPLVTEELMMPILGVVKATDVDEAILIAKELEHENKHSAHIHSKNTDNLEKFEKELNTTVLVKNAPSYSILGIDGGILTFTIASRTGDGLTSPRTFTKRSVNLLSRNV